MKKKVIAGSLALLAATAMYAQTYQLPNVGFENWEWEKAKGILWTEKNKNQGQPGEEPQSWHSSNIKFATGWAGSYQELVQKKSDNGKTYANVINKKSGQASSYIPTLGTLTIGNTWYANSGDGNATGGYRATNEKFAQNGTYGGISFVGRPDAIVGDFQNYSSDSHIIAYLWKGSFNGEVPATFDDGATGSIFNRKYNPTIKSWLKLENLDRAIWSQIDPSIVTSETVQNITKSDDAAIIAYCDKAFNESFTWATVEIPLNYLSAATPEKTNVIIAAGYPWDSRKSVENNNICADNIRYVYYSRLSDASIDGYAFDFNPNTLDYVITVDDVENFTLPTGVNYSIMSNEALTADKEATVSSINDNKQISIKVTNKQSIANAEATDADGLLEHTYNFYFREAPQQFEGFYFTNVNGTDIYSGETTTLTLTQENADYHTYTLAIADVKVAQAATRAAGDAVNVTVSGLTKTEKDGKVIYSGTDYNAKVGDETKQVSAVATFDGDNYEVKFSFTNEDGTVTNVVSTPEPTTSSVSEINGATAAVAATEGAILVSNYNGAAAVYTTDGRLAANAEVNGSASINVAAGLYIVRTGNKATKVIVK